MFAGIVLASNFFRTYQLIGCSVYNIYLAVRHISTLYFLKTHSFINNDTLENCAMDSKSEIWNYQKQIIAVDRVYKNI